MHPVLQSVQNATTSGYQQSRRSQHVAMRPPSPPRYPAQHSLPAGASPAQPQDDYVTEPPVCGLTAGAGIDTSRMRERDATRRANVPENNFFKDTRDKMPQNDYERDMMYKSGQMVELNPDRVLEPRDFVASEGDPTLEHSI